MSKFNILSVVKKALCYFVGLFIITLGIVLSTKTSCGISPVSSIPRVCEKLWIHFGLTEKLGFEMSLDVASAVVYSILVILQLVVLGKRFRPFSILGIPLAIVFGRMVKYSGIILEKIPNPADFLDPAKYPDLVGQFNPTSVYLMQLLYLAISMVVIAIGVFLYLRPHWLPMPAEGLAAAISQRSKLAFGNCKTIVDSSMIAIALIFQLVFLGWFSSFVNSEVVVVREGTIASAILIGQIVKLLTKWMGKKVDKWIA